MQRCATKFILKTDDDYDVRISKPNLLPLEQTQNTRNTVEKKPTSSTRIENQTAWRGK